MAAFVAHDAFRLFAWFLAAASVASGFWLLWYSVRPYEDGSSVSPEAMAAPASILPPTLRFAPDTYAVLERLPSGSLVEVAKSPCRIGRHSSDDVVVNDVRVSRHHARLEHSAHGVEIYNETAGRSEPNPMLINGVYRENGLLGDGDIVSLGGIAFRVHIVDRS